MKRKPTTREWPWYLCFSLVVTATFLVVVHALTVAAFLALIAAAVGLPRVARTR